MGNLAERLKDSKRSGVYRVSSPDIPILAATEAGADVHETDLSAAVAELRRAFRQRGCMSHGATSILLVRDITVYCDGRPPKAEQLVHGIQSAFGKLALANPRFVVIVDPLKAVDLPCLWNESAGAAA